MQPNDLVRVFAGDRILANKIRDRQIKGTMNEYTDEQGYLCYSQQEFDNWKPKKVGRKIKFN